VIGARTILIESSSMVRDGTPPPFGERASTEAPTRRSSAPTEARAAAVRVIVVTADGNDGARGRLAQAARAEGFATTCVAAAALDDALAQGAPHALLVETRGIADPDAFVACVACVAPAAAIVAIGADDAGALAWLRAGADDHAGAQDVASGALGRAVERAIARSHARSVRQRTDHADRLRTIAQLAAGVAHEVNNPAAFLLMNLRTCREYVGELRDRLQPGGGSALLDEMSEMLDDNVRGVERIVTVVEALRGYVRTDGEEPASVALAEVCRGAISTIAAWVRQHAQLELALDGGDGVRVRVDAVRFAQVIVNLVGNAADACAAAADRAPPGGHRVTVTLERRGGHAVVRVADTGAGMTPAVRARVFDPFFTTKACGRGTGLGLAIARDVVERYGGRVTVDSVPGRGARFDVILPVDPEQVASAGSRGAELLEPPTLASGSGGGAASVAAATRRRTRVRLLLVEDEASLALAISRQLRRYHDVTVAHDGETAVALAGCEVFDVVLCDVNMPGLDGPGVHAALAERRLRLADRMIFMTGGLFGEASRAALAAIGAPVLGKPIALSPLLDAIDAARTR
jgi:signal transduction histidine kinase